MEAISYNEIARIGRKIALETLKRRQKNLFDFVGIETSSDRDRIHGVFRSHRSPQETAKLFRFMPAA